MHGRCFLRYCNIGISEKYGSSMTNEEVTGRSGKRSKYIMKYNTLGCTDESILVTCNYVSIRLECQFERLRFRSCDDGASRCLTPTQAPEDIERSTSSTVQMTTQVLCQVFAVPLSFLWKNSLPTQSFPATLPILPASSTSSLSIVA